MKTIINIVVALVLCAVANGNPEERAQVLKAAALRLWIHDSWQLTNETQSQLTFERQASVTETVLMRMMTGASGSGEVDRVVMTFLPVSDRHIEITYNWSVNGSNAFGQVRSVPVKNKRTSAYILAKAAQLSAEMQHATSTIRGQR